MNPFKKYFIFFLGILCGPVAVAQSHDTSVSTASGYYSVGFFTDQDLFVNMFNLGKDRNYTMGVGIYYANSKLHDSWITAPIRWISKKLWTTTLHPANEEINAALFLYSLMLGNGSFTPDELQISQPIFNDRPYGNITYIQQNLACLDSANYALHKSSFIIGVLGSYISREVQTEIHSWSNENDTKPPWTPRGWNHQISAGGELTMALTRSTDYLITRRNYREQRYRPFSAELKHGWKYSVGYYTSLQYDLGIRLGLLDPNNWTYEVNPLTNSNQLHAAVAPSASSIGGRNYFKRQTRPEVYLLASARPVFMLYNALLNGQFRKSVVTLRFRDMKHLVFEWDLGIGGRIPFSANSILDVRWRAISSRSTEFKLPGRDARSHYWGGIDLIFTHYK